MYLISAVAKFGRDQGKDAPMPLHYYRRCIIALFVGYNRPNAKDGEPNRGHI